MKPDSSICFVIFIAAAVFAVFPSVAFASEDEVEEDPEAPFNPWHGDVRLPAEDKQLLVDIACSIRRGRKYLESKQLADGTWKCQWAEQPPIPFESSFGETALALLAILRSREDFESECILKGFSFLRMQPLKKTYSVALLMLAIEARWNPGTKQGVRYLHELWDRFKESKNRVVLPRNEESWMEECVSFLLANRAKSGRFRTQIDGKSGESPDVWDYPGPAGTSPDHSNTHVAIFGLRAAERCGLLVPAEVWESALKHFLDTQESEGFMTTRTKIVRCRRKGFDFEYFRNMEGEYDRARGWCYKADTSPETCTPDKLFASTGSMTAAGIACILSARSALMKKQPDADREARIDAAVSDGFAWLGRYWDVEKNPNHPERLWRFYYYWALGQAASQASRRAIGRHEWFREIARHLLSTQRQDGSWDDPCCPGPVSNTCFALLFLSQ